MSDYDSDTIVFGPEVPSKKDRYATAGAASMLVMLENAMEDRLATKKRSRLLELSKKSTKTEDMYYLWWARFSHFREHTLKRVGDAVTTGQDIERFMPSICRAVIPRLVQQAAVPSALWLQRGIQRVIECCTFYEKDFALTKQERSRISTVLNDLLREGAITNERKLSKEWVGVALVAHMMAALFENAIREGTLNWDCTIHRGLCIVLMCALACRSGDITKDYKDTNMYPCLIWEDIEMYLPEDGHTINDLEAIVTLRNEKFYKDDAQRNRMVRLVALKEASQNIMCPIKLLIILALRTGAVRELDIESLLKNMVARPSRRVVWRHPKRPVLSMFDVRGSWLILDKAATTHHMIRVTQTVAKMAGLLKYIHPHDFRRGAARDLSKLPAGVLRHDNLRAVGRALGHALNQQQTTRDYVGDNDDDTWTARVNHPAKSTRMKNIPLADTGYKRTKISKDMCIQWCQDQGLQHENPANIQKARRELERQNWEKWMQSGLELRDQPIIESLDTSHPSRMDDSAWRPDLPAGDDNVVDDGEQANEAASTTVNTTTRDHFVPDSKDDESMADAPAEIPTPTTMTTATRSPRISTVHSHRKLEKVRRTVIPDSEDDEPITEEEDNATRNPHISTVHSHRKVEKGRRTVIPDSEDDEPITEEEDNLSVPNFDDVDGYDPHEFGVIDEEEIARAESLIATITNPQQSQEEDCGELLFARLQLDDQEQATSSDSIALDFCSMEPLDFVRQYSTINTFIYNVKRLSANDSRMTRMGGNSKNEPTQMLVACKNKQTGCKLSFATNWQLKKHEQVCKSATTHLHKTKTLKCDTCETHFTTVKGPNIHKRQQHNFVPRTCGFEGCTNSQVFTTHKDWERHRKNIHLNQQLKCPVDGCKTKSTFRLPSTLGVHVRSVHNYDEANVTKTVEQAQENKENNRG